MSNKTANKKKNASKKQAIKKKGLSKKAIIAIVCAAVLVVAATIIIIACVNKAPAIDMAKVKASLENAGYKVNDYVPEVKGYTGVTQTLSGTYRAESDGSLASLVNTKQEKISFVRFDSAENAKKAFEDFRSKWGADYEIYDLSGDVMYFGTKVAYKAAITE